MLWLKARQNWTFSPRSKGAAALPPQRVRGAVPDQRLQPIADEKRADRAIGIAVLAAGGLDVGQGSRKRIMVRSEDVEAEGVDMGAAGWIDDRRVEHRR